MRIVVIICIVMGCLATHASAGTPADTTLRYTVTGGSSLQVPAGKQWTIEKITCSAGAYPVKVTSILPETPLLENEKLAVPYFVSEAQLLADDMSGVQYTIIVQQKDIP